MQRSARTGRLTFRNCIPMIRSYLRIAWRNLRRQPGFSIINILGLSIGLACTIIIVLYIRNELSYDRFHANGERIYRLTAFTDDISVAITPAPVAQALANDLPEIKSAVRTSMYTTHLLQAGETKFEETRVLYADSNFFEVFSFPVAKGDLNTALKRAESAVLSRDAAKRYFGDEDPIGKSIRLDNKEDLTVTGVLDAYPNSHLQPAVIIPMSYLARTEWDLKNNVWDNFNFYTFVELQETAGDEQVKKTDAYITSLYKKHVDEKVFRCRFGLQPLSRIHLHSNFMADVPGHGSASYVTAFAVIAVFILVVACINFMNLSTARSARRAKEVGMRKVSGAVRSQLVAQFLAESIIITFISVSIAIVFVFISIHFVNDLAGKQLSFDISDGKLLLMVGAIAVLTGVLAGSYPAIVLSGFVPARVLKREVTAGNGGVVFRNVLVVVQFVVSIVLLAGTAMVYSQLSFMRNKSIGYSQDNLIYVELKGTLGSDLSALASRLGQNRFTEHFSLASNAPTNLVSGTAYLDWEGKDKEAQVIFAHLSVDDHFIDVFGMQMAAGRNFSKNVPADSSNYLINETAAGIMGMTPESAVGQRFTLWNKKGTIVGVVRDFNFKPLQQKVEPMVLRYRDWLNIAVIRVQPQHTQETIRALEGICRELNPAYPFSYKFIDQDLKNLYESDEQVGSLFNVFAALAIFISCLGLYGLSAFVAEQRTREIGIRKTLGASIYNIVRMLSLKFILPIAVAVVMAAPVSFYFMEGWLSGFAYRIAFGWDVFISAGVIALGIGLLTISFECIKAARINPARSLRSE